MASLNSVHLIGYLGQNPESRTLPSGRMVTSFSLATTDYWTDKKSGAKKERTDWHKVVAYGRPAEIAKERLQKGSCCSIVGKVRYHHWDDENGRRRWRTDIEVGLGGLQVLPGKNVAGDVPANMQVLDLPVEELAALPEGADEIEYADMPF